MKNYQLIIGKDKLLGNLLLFQDRNGRASLTIVFSRKVKFVNIFLDAKRTGKIDRPEKLFSSHILPKSATQEISYKFSNKNWS